MEFEIEDFKNPLAPELEPSITAGNDIVCAVFIVIDVSVCISNKNKSNTLTSPVYAAFCNL